MTPADDGLPVLPFADAGVWEGWLAANGGAAAGVWLKLPKKGNAESTLTRAQAVDGALIHGWIDGQAGKWDDAWSLIRMTRRRARSPWSEKNRTRADELIAAGRMAPAGLAEVERARADGRWDAAYPPASSATVPDDLAAALAANPPARAFFDTLSGANRYAILYRIHEAKRPETRAKRIKRFVAMCAAGETVFPSER
ncbi:Uncharacterized conserved protein YdeI, YjbR/CyaY-like superfamily, DUF1801 family [Sphingomonas guangdongensis]|uniref:Uncharacterized conserved protein YdeI, YjbR/CyaY-like superfamily, DUF1801 family n=1 Tax=Sphingomonas guangdongensis TaxID=1141890 RepID=A0A285QGA4_9SPHN|nr:YdeI/OmpD-associated family protein [Sphingomonas guangdongensis]SOB80548.1 Uncharacterized conserved protein YdeI, YjbR/CyaY-like superfamily, DUF1801 family [Sphingomonas guangdongensis]